jgi:hypothetical protein
MPAVNEVPIKNSPSVFCSHCIHFSSVVSMFVMAETELIVFLKSRTLPNLNVSTHSYTFFCALLCSPYCAGILLYTVGVSFCDGSFYDDSLLRHFSSRTEHPRLVVRHCRHSSVLSVLMALLALFRCACVSSFSILVQFSEVDCDFSILVQFF